MKKLSQKLKLELAVKALYEIATGQLVEFNFKDNPIKGKVATPARTLRLIASSTLVELGYPKPSLPEEVRYAD